MKQEAIANVSLGLIDFAPQVRKRFDEEALASLEQSIRSIGVQEPVQLLPLENERFGILNGERRCRAAIAAGLATIPAIIVTDRLEAAAILERQLVLNMVRQDLSPIEMARGIDSLLEESGRTATDVAETLGLSMPTVSRLRILLTLPPEIQVRIEEGHIAASVAAELARVPNPELQRSLADEVAAGGLTRDGLIDRIRGRSRPSVDTNGHASNGHASNGSNGNGLATGRLTAALGAGRSITVAGPGLDSLDTLVVWLTELAAEARKVKNQKLGLATFARMLRDRAKAGKDRIDPKTEGDDAVHP